MKILDVITIMIWLMICSIDLDYVNNKDLIIGLIILSLFLLVRLYHAGNEYWEDL